MLREKSKLQKIYVYHMISVINKAKYYYILIWRLIQSSEINIGTEINMKFSILVTRRDRRMDGTVSKGV